MTTWPPGFAPQIKPDRTSENRARGGRKASEKGKSKPMTWANGWLKNRTKDNK